MKEKFEIIEEDDIVIYDESDDYDPGEDTEENTSDDNEFHLMTNEEIFTDEYMDNYIQRMDKKIADEKKYDNITSVCVILGCILLIGLFVSYAYFRYF